MTKSATATPGFSDLQVNTVKIEGSTWSNETELIVLKCAKLYL